MDCLLEAVLHAEHKAQGAVRGTSPQTALHEAPSIADVLPERIKGRARVAADGAQKKPPNLISALIDTTMFLSFCGHGSVNLLFFCLGKGSLFSHRIRHVDYEKMTGRLRSGKVPDGPY
jgi:hypothetical protein